MFDDVDAGLGQRRFERVAFGDVHRGRTVAARLGGEVGQRPPAGENSGDIPRAERRHPAEHPERAGVDLVAVVFEEDDRVHARFRSTR